MGGAQQNDWNDQLLCVYGSLTVRCRIQGTGTANGAGASSKTTAERLQHHFLSIAVWLWLRNNALRNAGAVEGADEKLSAFDLDHEEWEAFSTGIANLAQQKVLLA